MSTDFWLALPIYIYGDHQSNYLDRLLANNDQWPINRSTVCMKNVLWKVTKAHNHILLVYYTATVSWIYLFLALHEALMRPLIALPKLWLSHRVLWSPLWQCPSATAYGCMAEQTICSLSQDVPAGDCNPRSQTVLMICKESHSGDWPQYQMIAYYSF